MYTPFKMCFMCVASVTDGCEVCVCMDRLYLAMPHHTLIPNCGNWLNKEQILQLVNSAWHVNLAVVSAFMGFIWRVTIRRPRRWSLRRVKWGEGRGSDTNAAPALSVSSCQPDLLKIQYRNISVSSFCEYLFLICHLTCWKFDPKFLKQFRPNQD